MRPVYPTPIIARKEKPMTAAEILESRAKAMNDRVQYKAGVDKYHPSQGPSTQELLVAEVTKIAQQIRDASVMQPPDVKSFDRATRKVDQEYAGDWMKVKDLNRCTLVVPTKEQIEGAYTLVKKHFNYVGPNSPLVYHAEKITRPDSNPCGYSGYTVFLRTFDGQKAEVQINYPSMLYAKSLPEFKATLGEDAMAAMWVKYGPVPGGLGHKMYEMWQNNKAAPIGDQYAAACKMYYEFFQANTVDMRKGQQALALIRDLKLPGVALPPLFRG